MKQGQFEQLYETTWQKFNALLLALEEKKSKDEIADAECFAQLYRRICHFHAIAMRRNYSSFLVDQLSDLVVRGHQHLYQRRSSFSHDFIRFFVLDFPRLLRAEQKYFWWATAIFYLPALLIAVAVWFQPELIYTVMNPDQAENMEQMYDPANKILGSARDAETNWHMFGYYISNNIGVSFRTFASGLLWGVGSIFFLFYNGIVLGAVSAHMLNMQQHEPFFTFVVGHGSFELTAIIISGAAGLKLGLSLLFPGGLSRKDALLKAAHVAIKLIYGVIVMLLIAAFIEAFWSSNNIFYAWQKYFVGAVLWALVVAYLVLGGRRFGS